MFRISASGSSACATMHLLILMPCMPRCATCLHAAPLQGERMADVLKVPRLKARKNWYVGLNPDPTNRSPDVGDGSGDLNRLLKVGALGSRAPQPAASAAAYDTQSCHMYSAIYTLPVHQCTSALAALEGCSLLGLLCVLQHA